jgi:flagella basal body P-ring formation protein FlgA
MRPTNRERRVDRTIMLVILLAAATHLLSSQLARGGERFMPADRGADVELRGEATVVGSEIRFKQIARWADADKPVFDPIGELIVTRFAGGQAFRKIELTEIKKLLTEAGVNVGPLNFVGAITCTINRSDATLPEGAALDQFENAKAQQNAKKPLAALLLPASKDAIASKVTFPDAGAIPQQEQTESTSTLRDALTRHLSEKLNLPIESLQITFRPQDEKLLRLAEPQFKFSIEAQRAGNLGNVSWSVTVVSDKGTSRIFVPAEARAWQQQLVIAKPLSTKQVITDADVVERRQLVDSLPPDTLLARPQTVGQMASRELKPGMVVTARLVDAVQLVRTGQFVTVESRSGGVRLKIVGKALDPGTLGQTVRVRNEATREVIQATVTGPQTASLG